MMFEPGLTRGTLGVLVAPPPHLHCATDDQSTKAIDIQNAYLNGKIAHPPRRGGSACAVCFGNCKSPPKGARPAACVMAPQGWTKSRTK